MAQRQMYDDERTHRNALKAVLEKLSKADFSPDKSPSLGLPDAEDTIADAQRIVRLYASLQNVDLSDLPFESLQEIYPQAQEAQHSLDELTHLLRKRPVTIQPGDWGNLQDKLRAVLKRSHDTINHQVTTAIISAQDFPAKMAQIKEGIRSAIDLLAEVQQTAKHIGSAEHAKDFRNAAWWHQVQAAGWLIVIVVLVSLTGWLAYRQVQQITSEAKLAASLGKSTVMTLGPAEAVQLAIARITLLSILVFALAVAARSYRAHCHNVVVNKHRANALNSFKTFVNSTESPDIKNAVLLETTRCIFAAQNTGQTGRSDAPQGPSQVVEIATRALGGDKAVS